MMESKFTGGLLGLIGTRICMVLMIIFTLGFGTPWAVAYYQRWECNHTTIGGNQLKFVGTGGNLFGQYIKWILLTVITIGIYSFWLNIKMKQWVVSNTEFA